MSMTLTREFFPSDHLEQLSRGISAFTVDPYTNALFYFFPKIGAFFTNYQPLRSDPALEAMMPPEAAARILREIKDLTNCAGIKRDAIPYVALYHQFSSCGGPYSLTKPALFLPDQHLFRRNGHSSFGQEKPNENLSEKQWIFSDDETRFLIARELSQLKEESSLFRMAIKVSVFVTLFFIYTSPFGWPLGLSLFIGAIGTHIASERFFQGRADLLGVKILRRKIGHSAKVAIHTLEKMRQQNLYKRKNSKAARWYITKSGNNLLDLLHPPLTTRIKKLTTV